MQPDEWDAKAREMARAILLDTQAIQVEGTSDNASGYGPPYKAPWYIMDTSKAEPEVNWPGELIEIVTDPGMISKRLMAAREKIALLVICEAYQRGRNEADAAAERRGIERAADLLANWVNSIRVGFIDGTENEAIFLERFERAIRALARTSEPQASE